MEFRCLGFRVYSLQLWLRDAAGESAGLRDVQVEGQFTLAKASAVSTVSDLENGRGLQVLCRRCRHRLCGCRLLRSRTRRSSHHQTRCHMCHAELKACATSLCLFSPRKPWLPILGSMFSAGEQLLTGNQNEAVDAMTFRVEHVLTRSMRRCCLTPMPRQLAKSAQNLKVLPYTVP